MPVFGDEEVTAAEPAATPDPDLAVRRRWLSPGAPVAEEAPAPASEPIPAAPRVKLGGTLFERMSSVSRGAAREDEPSDKDSVDIPRFLHRQNNQ